MKRTLSVFVTLFLVTLAAQAAPDSNAVVKFSASSLTNYPPQDMVALRKQAARGDVKAQYKLGQAYLHGLDAPKDLAEGVRWIRMAAERRYPEAMTGLGWCYEHGLGVVTNEGESVMWMRRAAEAGEPFAQTWLGDRLYHGACGTTNEAEAYIWLSRASVQGAALGQQYLGELLVGRKRYLEAYRWLVLADRHGQIQLEPLMNQCTQNMTPEQIAEAQRWSREFVPVTEWKDNVYKK